MKIDENEMSEEKMSVYREHFKLYKSGPLPNDGKDVLDLKNAEEAIPMTVDPPTDRFAFLIPLEKWKIYDIKSCPGLFYIKNPFTAAGQRYWVARCLRDYPKPPNKKNIDAHVKDKKLLEWGNLEECTNLHKLRWTTFGYHHDWDTKVYNEKLKSAFPADLNHLCKYIANVFGYCFFKPEAAIVNYYPLNSTLYGHVDISEKDFEAPIVSLSFGQSAIFLIGKNLNTKPTALYLHSGDIVVMSKESRLFVHGVPRIFAQSKETWNEDQQHKEEEIQDDVEPPVFFQKDLVNEAKQTENNNKFWSIYDKYLKTTRVNINVRQVLKRGQKRLLED